MCIQQHTASSLAERWLTFTPAKPELERAGTDRQLPPVSLEQALGSRAPAPPHPQGCDRQSDTEAEGSSGAINTREWKDKSEGKSSSSSIPPAPWSRGNGGSAGRACSKQEGFGAGRLPLPHRARVELINWLLRNPLKIRSAVNALDSCCS